MPILCVCIAVMSLFTVALARTRLRQVAVVLRDIAHDLMRLVADGDRAEKVDHSAHDQHDAKKGQRRGRYEPIPDSFDFMFCHKS